MKSCIFTYLSVTDRQSLTSQHASRRTPAALHCSLHEAYEAIL